MNKFTYSLALFGIFAVSVGANILDPTGKSGVAGSPGEGTCVSCHSSFALNSGGGSVAITSNIPNDQYVPGTTYQISVTVQRQTSNLFGLCTEALTAANANAGTLAITNSAESQIKTGGNGRKCVTHKQNGGAAANTKTFSFNWTAPAAGTGTVTFYSSGMAANGNGGTSGDYVYTTTKAFTEATSGIDKATEMVNIKTYPNPVVDVLKISLDKTGSKTINLVDMNGKVIKTETINADVISFDMKGLATGIYSVQVWNENNQLLGTKKVVKY